MKSEASVNRNHLSRRFRKMQTRCAPCIIYHCNIPVRQVLLTLVFSSGKTHGATTPSRFVRFLSMQPIIQIAGIIDQDEATLLTRCGVSHLGFPFRLPVHREDLTEEEAAIIIARLKLPVKAVLITYLNEVDKIIALVDKLGTDVIQLHGDIDGSVIRSLRMKKPDLELWKSLIVRKNNGDELERRVFFFEDSVDAFITDTCDPSSGATGATGRTHNWNISRRLVEISKRPVILAGGLTPDNVKRAIYHVAPAGVDAHTGVEGPAGRKSRDLVTAFVTEANRGFSKR